MEEYKVGNWKLEAALPAGRQGNWKKFLLIFAVVFILYILVKAFLNSLFIDNSGRVNFVIYDKEPVFYSLGLDDGLNYAIAFPADLKLNIPGGYGSYRIGALRKLVDLEKDPTIFKKTFSFATASFLDLYFYPSKTEVYYGKSRPFLPLSANVYKLFIYRSNANIFDRIYLFFKIGTLGRSSLNPIEDFSDEKEFFKNYQGYLYKKTYRTENRNVQIKYTKSYVSAVNISNILEGNGIKVADISIAKMTDKRCRVIESGTKFSKTAKDTADFFDCLLQHGKTETVDIIVELGETEGKWE